jgi:RNA polymerase sigma-70 factor, ECF subfamily
MESAQSERDEFEQRLATEGVKGAGEWLVKRYADDVFGLCCSIVRRRATAEDLTQEVFSKALAALSAYRGDAAPRTWLLAIARHRCIDELRALRRERTLFLDEASDTYPDEMPLVLDRITSSETARQALDALDEGDRSVVVLRFGHGLEYQEIADVFGVRQGAVRMRVSRALSRMREALGVSLSEAPGVAGAVLGAAPPAPRTPAPAAAPAALPAMRARVGFGGGKPPAAPHPGNAHLREAAPLELRERLLSLVRA